MRVEVQAVAFAQHPALAADLELDAAFQHEEELLSRVVEEHVAVDLGGESEDEGLHLLVVLAVSEAEVVVTEGAAPAHHRAAFARTHHTDAGIARIRAGVEES